IGVIYSIKIRSLPIGVFIYFIITTYVREGKSKTKVALITAAAKATSSVLESRSQNLTPSNALKIMNYAIHETAKGSVLMTFFLAAIDLKTGAGKFSNASHEVPFLVPRKEEIKKKDLNFLLGARGTRLGELRDTDYPEGDFQMNPGDAIILFTDGVPELRNKAGEQLGERKFLNALVSSASKSGSTEKIMRGLRSKIVEFRGDAELADDLMLIVCQYDPLTEAVEDTAV
ncbi:MAG: PP2C family protein-serine/threonine phosphatase, partial [Bdellovibrionales bacterium]